MMGQVHDAAGDSSGLVLREECAGAPRSPRRVESEPAERSRFPGAQWLFTRFNSSFQRSHARFSALGGGTPTPRKVFPGPASLEWVPSRPLTPENFGISTKP